MRYSSADRASEDCLVTFLSSLSATPPSANSFRVTVKIVVEMQIFPEKNARGEATTQSICVVYDERENFLLRRGRNFWRKVKVKRLTGSSPDRRGWSWRNHLTGRSAVGMPCSGLDRKLFISLLRLLRSINPKKLGFRPEKRVSSREPSKADFCNRPAFKSASEMGSAPKLPRSAARHCRLSAKAEKKTLEMCLHPFSHFKSEAKRAAKRRINSPTRRKAPRAPAQATSCKL